MNDLFIIGLLLMYTYASVSSDHTSNIVCNTESTQTVTILSLYFDTRASVMSINSFIGFKLDLPIEHIQLVPIALFCEIHFKFILEFMQFDSDYLHPNQPDILKASESNGAYTGHIDLYRWYIYDCVMIEWNFRQIFSKP